MARGEIAALLIACTLLSAVVVVHSAPTAPVPVGVQSEPPLPDAAGVVSAYFMLDEWVRRFGDLPGMDDPAAHVEMPGAHAVSIILRSSGRVIGIGEDATGDALMLRRAAGRAMSQVLSDRSVQREDDPSAADDGQSAPSFNARETIGRNLTIEIEVAGRFVPLPGRSFEQATASLEPGLDGVALRKGDAWFVLYPAQMRANNTADNIERLVPGLAMQAGLPRQPLDELARTHDASLYRFRTVHLLQPSSGEMPQVTYRGDQLVPLSSIDQQRVAQLADGIARHLMACMWPDEDQPLGVRGGYRISVGDHQPLVAPPTEQALVAMALAHYARAPHVDEQTAARAADTAVRILIDLTNKTEVEPEPTESRVACAAIIHAVLALEPDQRTPAIEALLRRAVPILRAGMSEAGWFFEVGELHDTSVRVSPPQQAMMLAALAAARRAGDETIQFGRQVKALQATWADVVGPHRLAMLPWIGWAERDLAASVGGRTPNAMTLIELQDMLSAALIPDEPHVPPDVRGGFAVAELSGTRATAHTAQPAAFLATMLRDPLLVDPSSRPQRAETLRQILRFLTQLSVREPLLGTIKHPNKALGGIRQSPWNSDMPPAAQVMAMLTATETLHSLTELQRESNVQLWDKNAGE